MRLLFTALACLISVSVFGQGNNCVDITNNINEQVTSWAACSWGWGIQSTDNIYYQSFNLDFSNYPGYNFHVSSIDVGIYDVVGVPNTSSEVGIYVSIYQNNSGLIVPAYFNSTDVDLISQVWFPLTDSNAGTIVNIPISAVISGDDTGLLNQIIISVETPDFHNDIIGVENILIGMNSSGAFSETYITAPDCGSTLYSNLETYWGYDIDMVLSIAGCYADIYGCTYSTAINYDAFATDDDGSCLFEVCDPNAGYNSGYETGLEDGYLNGEDAGYDMGLAECDPNAGYQNGWEDGFEAALNEANCPGDLDNDGSVSTGDLLVFLSSFGANCFDNEECFDDESCDDGNPCTIDYCENGDCYNEIICCQTDAECDDYDSSTTDYCVDGECVHY
jgi:hypothetical protein